MTDTYKPIESLDRVFEQINTPLTEILMNSQEDDYHRILRALKLAEAVEKDISEGRVMVPAEPTTEMNYACDAAEEVDLSEWRDIDIAIHSVYPKIYKAAISDAPQSYISALEGDNLRHNHKI